MIFKREVLHFDEILNILSVLGYLIINIPNPS